MPSLMAILAFIHLANVFGSSIRVSASDIVALTDEEVSQQVGLSVNQV